MKSKKLWLGIGAVVLIVLCMGVAFLATQGKTDYYTQIDNRWVTEIDPHGTMNYEYNLDAYDETGKERDITFETSKVLTDGCVSLPESGTDSWCSNLGRGTV